MFRFLLIIFIFLSTIMAKEIIKNVEVLKIDNKETQINDIKSSNKFKNISLPFIKKDSSDYILKITLDKITLDNKTYAIELQNEFNVMYLEKTMQYKTVLKNKVITYNKNSTYNTLYIKIDNDEEYINFNIKIMEDEKFIQKHLILNKIFGISYGIIFTAFLYYFALYLFNREKSYIYYSLTQISMLAILIFITLEESQNDEVIIGSILLAFFIFSNLFTKSFLNTKINTPIIDKILTFAIYLFIVDFFIVSILQLPFISDFIPTSLILLLYIITAIIAYKNSYKPALFYLLGWSIMILSFILIEVQYYFPSLNIPSQQIYILHFFIPLESLVLAFALSYKMKMLEKEKEEQKEFLVYQSKLASMGEMIANIAHQWRQPLTFISYILMNLQTAYKLDKLNDEFFNKKIHDATSQLEYMSHTIDDFRNFFKINKEKENFDIVLCINDVISLLDQTLKNNDINVSFDSKEKIEIYSYKGEFQQVVFNLINNAKDALISNNIQEPSIKIELVINDKDLVVSVLDNALGIKENIIESIFEPYFTTKDDGQGIGLYMSKMIIEKNMKGKLMAKNITNGAKFVISLPK